jgi:tRNA threonylcarbamoyladenosine biosynthesis protein TsaB
VRHTHRLIVAVVDARRGEVFHAFYRQVPGGVQRVTEPQVATPEELASELLARDEECLLVGDGALRHRDVLDDVRRVELGDEGFAHPSASSLVQLAHPQALREEFVAPWELTPLYLRKPDAEINWSTRHEGPAA